MAILNFGNIFKKSLAHPHGSRNVMLKFQKSVTSHAGATKIPFPLWAGDNKWTV